MTLTRQMIFNIFRYLLILAIIVTIAFIFGNSMLPPEKSAEQSETVKDVIVEILPDDTAAENFVEEYIRKIAHFTEYGLLGVEIAIYLMVFTKRRIKVLAIATLTPFFIGFVDETIQRFSERGPSIDDVWIDIGGFVLFYLLTIAIFVAVFYVVKAIGTKIQNENKGKEEKNG